MELQNNEHYIKNLKINYLTIRHVKNKNLEYNELVFIN